MRYKLIISERAESHIDNILDYVVNVLISRSFLSRIGRNTDRRREVSDATTAVNSRITAR